MASKRDGADKQSAPTDRYLTDRQTDRQLPDRCFTLSVTDASSVIIRERNGDESDDRVLSSA